VSGVQFAPGMRLEPLRREHPRRRFRCGEETVENWLATKAFQHQEKHLSVTKVLLDEEGVIVGYYTLATGQVDFSDLPADVGRDLPRRLLPVAVLAWLGVSLSHQGQGLGGQRLQAAKGTNYSTTVKMLAVMLRKGLVKRDEQAQPHVYRTTFTRARTGKRMLDDLVEKVYDGSTMALVLQALSSGKASKEELDEVRRILDEMEGK
jgi:predicted transcriptional regulator